MATLSITIPDAQVNRINDAFAAHFSMTPSSANTKTQIIKFIKNVVKAEESKTAMAATAATVESEVALT